MARNFYPNAGRCGGHGVLHQPRTSEMHFVAALDDNPEMRCVLGLFEGRGKRRRRWLCAHGRSPRGHLLHLGPGLGNALANLHNAKQAHTPMVNIVGDHATYHSHFDAPSLPMWRGWLAPCLTGFGVPAMLPRWLGMGRRPYARPSAPGQIATLVLPADTAWDEGPGPHAGPFPFRLRSCLSPKPSRVARGGPG